MTVILIQVGKISTHAPHARRDISIKWEPYFAFYFYSRASCEARRRKRKNLCKRSNFYSRASCEARPDFNHSNPSTFAFLLTRLMRGATRAGNFTECQKMGFLLTRLMRGATVNTGNYITDCANFYSRASCEARQERKIPPADR